MYFLFERKIFLSLFFLNTDYLEESTDDSDDSNLNVVTKEEGMKFAVYFLTVT